jgi:hypothetical protein
LSSHLSCSINFDHFSIPCFVSSYLPLIKYVFILESCRLFSWNIPSNIFHSYNSFQTFENHAFVVLKSCWSTNYISWHMNWYELQNRNINWTIEGETDSSWNWVDLIRNVSININWKKIICQRRKSHLWI